MKAMISHDFHDEASLEYSYCWAKPSYYQFPFLPFKQAVALIEDELYREVSTIVSGYIDVCKEYSILDIGCGDGYCTSIFIKELNLQRFTYLGIDVNSSALYLCNKKLGKLWPSDFLCVDINTFPLKREWNMIIAFNSVYGISFNTLSYLISRLRPNGILALIVNSHLGIFSKIASANRRRVICDSHVKWFLESNGYAYDLYYIKRELCQLSDNEYASVIKYLSGKDGCYGLGPRTVVEAVFIVKSR